MEEQRIYKATYSKYGDPISEQRTNIITEDELQLALTWLRLNRGSRIEIQELQDYGLQRNTKS